MTTTGLYQSRSSLLESVRATRRPRTVAVVAILVALAVTVLVPAASAKKVRVYSAVEVRHGFAAVGDPLFDTGYSSFASPVTVLSTVKSRDGWSATVYVYPSVAKASASFRANRAGWQASGIAAEQVGNLVVTVTGRTRSRSSGGTAVVPPLVVRALALAARPKR
jgi:hypothetical protein